MTATVYFIDNLRRRRRIIADAERERLARQAHENRFRQFLDTDPDGTPPGGHAA